MTWFCSDISDVFNVNGNVITVCNCETKLEFHVHADRTLHVLPILRNERSFMNETSSLSERIGSRSETPSSASESEGNKNKSINVQSDQLDPLSRKNAEKQHVRSKPNENFECDLPMTIDR